MKKQTKRLVAGAVIAVLYVGFTFFSNIFGLAYGPVQFRISEVLTVLCVFTPAAVPGLAIGCFISNIASFNPIDMVFGTLATLCAALLGYMFRNVKIFSVPVFSFFAPVLINGVAVGAEIAVFWSNKSAALTTFAISALTVALGEFLMCFLLGVPLYFIIKNNKILFDFFSE